MAANYVQKFLDHAKLSTTSRYLNVNRDGMHAALKRFEDAREAEEVRAGEDEKSARGNPVANATSSGNEPKTEKVSKSVQ